MKQPYIIMPEKLQYFFNSALDNPQIQVVQIYRESGLLSVTNPQELGSPPQCYRSTGTLFSFSVLQIHKVSVRLHSVCQNAATGCSSPLFVNRMYKIYRARKSICVNICTSNLIKEWLRHHFGGGQRSGGRGCDSWCNRISITLCMRDGHPI